MLLFALPLLLLHQLLMYYDYDYTNDESSDCIHLFERIAYVKLLSTPLRR